MRNYKANKQCYWINNKKEISFEITEQNAYYLLKYKLLLK